MKKSVCWKSIVLLWGVMICACQQPRTEAELFKEASAIEDKAGRVAALRQFLLDFPDTKRRQETLRQILGDTIDLGQAEDAVAAAEEYLQSVPEKGRMRPYNFIAWALVEKGIGLDEADEYSKKAVEMAREADSGMLAGILDTRAYVLYKLERVEEALDLQLEALERNPVQAELVRRLALYQYKSGHTEKGMESAVEALLLGDSDESLANLQAWIAETGVDHKPIVNRAIEEYLQESDTPRRRRNAAFLLLRTDVDLERAEEYARQALDSLQDGTPEYEEADARVTLASILEAQDSVQEAISVLEEFSDRAPLYVSDFWSTLGNCYIRSENPQAAEEALFNGLLVRDNEGIRSQLRTLGVSEEAIEGGINSRKELLLAFDPGRVTTAELPTARPVLAELFTGAECNPCQAADYAFDLLSDYYPKSAFIILEHHLHIPGADPLTNRSTLDRYAFYGQDFGTPTVFMNGIERIPGGGPELLKKMSFERYQRVAEPLMAQETEVDLQVSAVQKEDQVDLSAVVSVPEGTGDLRIHVALVEESVDYVGGNGVSRHAFVVRHMVTGDDGEPLKLRSGKSQVDHSISLSGVEQDLKEYLDGFEKEPPERYAGFGGWIERPERLDRFGLAIVVWVQDHESREVFQAEYVEL